jgi:hypothetical protein
MDGGASNQGSGVGHRRRALSTRPPCAALQRPTGLAAAKRGGPPAPVGPAALPGHDAASELRRFLHENAERPAPERGPAADGGLRC